MSRSSSASTPARYGSRRLANAGNTCYINGLLQALSSCRSFTLQLEQGVAGSPSSPPFYKSLSGILSTLSSSSMLTPPPPPPGTKALKCIRDWLGSRNAMFLQDGGAAQQDPTEAMNVVMDGIAEEFPGPSNPTRLLQVVSIHKKQCGACGAISPTTEADHCLMLPITPGATTLQQLLEHYGSGETLAGLECSSCGGRTESRRWTKIEETSDYLAISLKRFEFDMTTMRNSKNATPIEAPLLLFVAAGEEAETGADWRRRTCLRLRLRYEKTAATAISSPSPFFTALAHVVTGGTATAAMLHSQIAALLSLTDDRLAEELDHCKVGYCPSDSVLRAAATLLQVQLQLCTKGRVATSAPFDCEDPSALPCLSLDQTDAGFRPKQSGTYKLIATITHHGATVSNGHYTAMVYDHNMEQFIHCDDDRSVREMAEEEVEASARDAYVLIYKRQ